MTFTRAHLDPPQPRALRSQGFWRVAGTIAIAVLLWLSALIPYDRFTPKPEGTSDLVPLGPGDPAVHTIGDLSRVYGISAAAEAHFRVDKRGIHYLRERTAEHEGRK
jgi:hypothetical protein